MKYKKVALFTSMLALSAILFVGCSHHNYNSDMDSHTETYESVMEVPSEREVITDGTAVVMDTEIAQEDMGSSASETESFAEDSKNMQSDVVEQNVSSATKESASEVSSSDEALTSKESSAAKISSAQNKTFSSQESSNVANTSSNSKSSVSNSGSTSSSSSKSSVSSGGSTSSSSSKSSVSNGGNTSSSSNSNVSSSKSDTSSKETVSKKNTSNTETTEKQHTHSYTAKITKQATCTSAGVKTYTCSCGSSYTESIPATGHKWDSGSVTTKATCTKTGVKTYTCQNCGTTKTESISATGHTWKTTSTQVWVVDQEAYTETVDKIYCECGASFDNVDELDAHQSKYLLAGDLTHGQSWVDEVEVDHPEVGHYETVTTTKCSVCGATQ